MIIETQVIDDFLPEVMANNVYETMLSNSFPWYYLPDVTYGHDHKTMEKNGISDRNSAFQHTFLNYFTGEPSVYLPLVILFPYMNSGKVQMPPAQISRVCSFLHTPNERNKNKKPNNIHVDNHDPHIVFLYYVCDSDGDTVIYTQDRENKTETLRVSPKKNRALIFDGSVYHSSSSPTQHPRCVINFNLTPF